MNTKDEKKDLEPKQIPCITKKPNQEYNAVAATPRNTHYLMPSCT